MSGHAAPRHNNMLFTVMVSVVMALGAVVMAVVLLLSGAPGALAVGALLAVLPVAPLVFAYLWLDRYEPEPRSLLLLGLGWGAFVATSSALVFQLIGKYAFHRPESFSGVVLAPVSEEAAKGLFILLLLWFRRHELDGVLDGIVYAGMVGIGFAFTENILYLTSAYVGDDTHAGGLGGAIATFVVRGVFSPFAHPVFTAFTGIGIGLAVNSRRRIVKIGAPILGYALAVAAHAAWNGSAFLGGPKTFLQTYLFLMVPAFILLFAFSLWSRRQEGVVLTKALTDCSRRGFLDQREIPWLVGLAARRQARTYAASVGGASAKSAMSDYQQYAIELGFLHHRYLRGVAPRDFASRGQYFVDAMNALRPRLVWPGQGAQVSAGKTIPNQANSDITARDGSTHRMDGQ